MKGLFWSVLAASSIAAGAWVCWIGAADYLLMPSLLILLIGLILLVAAGAPRGRSRFIHQTCIVLFFSLLAANVAGERSREPGLRARMIWGERIAENLELYRLEKGRYPCSLELLKEWGGSGVPDLELGGVSSYAETPDGRYELWLYTGFIEARMKTGKDSGWEFMGCW